MDWEDTCVGLAVAEGDGAKTILRVSGPNAHRIAEAVLTAKSPFAFDRIFAERCSLTIWGRELEATLYSWPAGRSYTGQCSIEVHWLLSSPPVAAAVAAQMLSHGARLAKPGEFTLRAFLAGRLDLSQAEGVLGLIEAENLDQLQQAIDQRAGGISRPIASLRSELLDLLADVEAGLDFVDEDITFISDEDLLDRLESMIVHLDQMLRDLQGRSLQGELPVVVLSGPPNAGKSSLLNALAGKEHAIVSPVSGTTRDHLSANLESRGVRFTLIDTAGIEAATTGVERSAQQQREKILRSAALTVHCLAVDDPSGGWPQTGDCLRVRTKADLDPAFTDSASDLTVSVHDPRSIDQLLASMGELLTQIAEGGDRFATSLSQRCRHSLELARQSLDDAASAVRAQAGQEFVALSLREALNHLGEIVGAVHTDDLLDKIFSKFCIGK